MKWIWISRRPQVVVERARLRRPIYLPGLVVILKMLPHVGRMFDLGQSQPAEQAAVANAGKLQNLRRVDRADSQDHFRIGRCGHRETVSFPSKPERSKKINAKFFPRTGLTSWASCRFARQAQSGCPLSEPLASKQRHHQSCWVNVRKAKEAR